MPNGGETVLQEEEPGDESEEEEGWEDEEPDW